MTRLLTLGGLAVLAVAEVAAVLLLVDSLGPTTTLLVLSLDVLLGLVLIRWAARGPVQDRGWRLAGGAFVALPGLVLDLVGVLLLVPGTRAWVRGHVARGTQSALRRHGVSVVTVTDPAGMPRATVVPGDVIPGVVVEPDAAGQPERQPPGRQSEPATPTDRAGGAPGPGPRVVRGELAGTEE